MRQIILDASGWKDKDDFYGDLLPSLGAPNWHGRNLDALNDSIRGDDINKMKIPFSFHIENVGLVPAELFEYIMRFVDLIKDLREAGLEVDIHLQQ